MESKKVLKGFIWRFLEHSGSQVVTFVVSIILARLLEPEVYGTIALVTVFIALLQVFVNSGFGTALIQKKDADTLDFSTIFYFNVVFGVLMYLLMFAIAPFIAWFYENPELTPLVRVLSLTLLISGPRNVLNAHISRNMQFKKMFWVTLGATIGSAIVGIAMAYKGYGVWALAGQTLTSSVISTVTLWIAVRWLPSLMFSFKRLGSLFRYSWKLLVSGLLDTLYNDLRTLIIGKKYTTEDLAFYNKGKTFPNLIVSNINASIDSVLLPVMSNAQNDKAVVKSMTRRAIKTSTYLMMPMMMGLAVCAEPIITLLLTEKWLFCVPYMQIFCFTFAFYPVHTANLNAIKAMGRSDLFLKLEIIKKVVGLIFLLSSMWFGVMAMALTLLITSVISQIINSWPNKKLLDYSYPEQLKDMLPTIAITLVMGALVYLINFINLNNWLTLIIQVPVGVIVYIMLSKVFKLEAFEYVWNMLRKFFVKKAERND